MWQKTHLMKQMNFVGNSKMESTTLLKIKFECSVNLSTKEKRHFTN